MKLKMEIIQEMFSASLEAIRPEKLVANTLQRRGNVLMVNDRTYELKNNVNIIGFGKASYGMTLGVSKILNDHIQRGLLSVPIGTRERYNSQLLDKRFTVMEGAKDNLPDDQSLHSATEIQKFAASLSADDILVTLISGGGSALLPLPAENISLTDKLETVKLVANSGGTIHQLNTIRKHLSQIKGGKLALLSPSYNIISLIISDIVGDPLDMIASGPTVCDTTTAADCLKIFEDLRVTNGIPSTILELLSSDRRLKTDTEINQIKQTISEKCDNIIVGNNTLALQKAVEVASTRGLQSCILSSQVEGDARFVGQCMAKLALNILTNNAVDKTILNDLCVSDHSISDLRTILEENGSGPLKLCLVFGGETTVTVKGTGQGGRNQHMVLSALEYLVGNHTGIDVSGLTFLSAGTDGQDGPTDAAGAFLDSDLVEQTAIETSCVKGFLENCGSYDFFMSNKFRSKYLLKPGLTGTNVMDIQAILVERK